MMMVIPSLTQAGADTDTPTKDDPVRAHSNPPVALMPMKSFASEEQRRSKGEFSRILTLRTTNVISEKSQPRRARKSWSELLQGTRQGQLLFLLCTGMALIVCGAITWRFVGPNESFGTGWWHCFCISYYLFIDVGTQTGIAPTDPGKVLAAAIFFSCCGLLFNLTLFGVLVDFVRRVLERWMKERSRIVLNGHTVVLGWTDKTLFLLKERLDAAENMGLRRQDIVVLAERDEVEMMSDVTDYLSHKLRRHEVRCRRGTPYNPNDLLRVSIASASDVIVLGASGSPHESDIEVMQILVAMGSMNEPVHGRIIAEVRCSESAPKVQTLLPNTCGIPARSAVSHLLCHMATNPAIGICFTSLCSFASGTEFYAVPVKDEFGATFGSARMHFSTSLCVAVRSLTEGVIIAPPDSYALRSDDVLIVLAYDACRIEGHKDSSTVAWAPNQFLHGALEAKEKIQNGIGGMIPRSSQVFPEGDMPTYEHSLESEVSQHLPRFAEKSSSIVIIAGWPDDCSDIVQRLDTYSGDQAKKMEVHILSEKNIQQREDLISAVSGTLQHVHLKHHLGDRTSVRTFTNLEASSGRPLLSEADAILVMAESDSTSAAQHSTAPQKGS
jgi:hypothetical protein